MGETYAKIRSLKKRRREALDLAPIFPGFRCTYNVARPGPNEKVIEKGEGACRENSERFIGDLSAASRPKTSALALANRAGGPHGLKDQRKTKPKRGRARSQPSKKKADIRQAKQQ